MQTTSPFPKGRLRGIFTPPLPPFSYEVSKERGKDFKRGAGAPLKRPAWWWWGKNYGISLKCCEGGGWEKIYIPNR